MRPLLALGISALLLAHPALTHATDPPTADAPMGVVATMESLAPLIEEKRGLKGFPSFTKAEMTRAEAGELVVRTLPVKGSSMPLVMISTVVPIPVEALYLVIADTESSPKWIDNLKYSTVVSSEKLGMQVQAFQYAEAPFPAQDRGWVATTMRNRSLYEASQGRYWEIWWEINEPLTQAILDETAPCPVPDIQDDMDGTIRPKVSTGSWSLIPLGDNRTYIEYMGFTNPDANAIERTAITFLGTKVQEEMIRDGLIPLAKGYAQGKATPPPQLTDMTGATVTAMVTRLKTLR